MPNYLALLISCYNIAKPANIAYTYYYFQLYRIPSEILIRIELKEKCVSVLTVQF